MTSRAGRNDNQKHNTIMTSRRAHRNENDKQTIMTSRRDRRNDNDNFPVPARRAPSSGRPSSGRDTVASSLLSATHGRKRRAERGIAKVDLQRARRHGMKEPARMNREKYTYGGVTFIYDPQSNREVTSYRSSSGQGTLSAPPVVLKQRNEFKTPEAMAAHKKAKAAIFDQKEKWKSHSILVIDMSGSMRFDDVRGARSRSDGVWMALARDFVKNQLEEKQATQEDLVSVILMRRTPEVILQCEPIDYVLFNMFIDYREWSTLRPEGPGNYLPALSKAEELLDLNTSGSCALALYFFSDGKPSDRGPFADRMGSIASRFGRRLTVSCVGMANGDEDFTTLAAMANEAGSFGAISKFERPSLDTDALSRTISSLVTSMATTKSDLTCRRTGMAKRVRTDIRRENRHAADDLVLTNDWKVYHTSTPEHYVQRVWIWDPNKDDFVYIRDARCIFCYKEVLGNTSIATLCPDCQACWVCNNCEAENSHRGTASCRTFRENRQNKEMVCNRSVPSFSVAMKETVFGEGVERIVHKFRFLDGNKKFVGNKWVAKQSRFVEKAAKGETIREARMGYHKEFMRSQVLSKEFALRYNEALDSLPYGVEFTRRLPRIRFLEPLLVELYDNGEEKKILIEEMLEGTYEKFNNNMGYVDKQDANGSKSKLLTPGQKLVVIDEDEEDDNEPANNYPGVFGGSTSNEPIAGCNYKHLNVADFPQAFSHFTYEKSQKNFLVCDLQGVLQTNEGDGTCEFVLTDPAIHRTKPSKNIAIGGFGRTDRGEKGIKAFFDSHICSDACNLLGLVQEIDLAD